MPSELRWAAAEEGDPLRATRHRVTPQPGSEPRSFGPRVLFLWSVDGFGGTETRLIEMADMLAQAGCRDD